MYQVLVRIQMGKFLQHRVHLVHPLVAKRQTSFYGSPIRHSVNLVHSSLPSPSIPVSPDRKVRFATVSQESDFQVGQSRVTSPIEAGGFSRKFTRFPSINSSDNPLRRTEK